MGDALSSYSGKKWPKGSDPWGCHVWAFSPSLFLGKMWIRISELASLVLESSPSCSSLLVFTFRLLEFVCGSDNRRARLETEELRISMFLDLLTSAMPVTASHQQHGSAIPARVTAWIFLPSSRIFPHREFTHLLVRVTIYSSRWIFFLHNRFTGADENDGRSNKMFERHVEEDEQVLVDDQLHALIFDPCDQSDSLHQPTT